MIIIIVFALYEPLGSLSSLLFRLESGLANRDHLWTQSLNIIKDHPLFGIGPGAFKYEMFNYFPVMLNSWEGELFVELYNMTGGTNVSHNFFLFFFSEMGILGLITAFTLPLIFFRIGIKTLKKHNNLERRYYFIVTLIVIGIAIFVRSFVENIGVLNYGRITADLPFWLVFSSLVYYYRKPSIPSEENESSNYKNHF
jgi:O-antigen ligase